MKLSVWAKEKGVSYRTAWRWFKAGKINGAIQESSGTIFVEEKIDETIAQALKNIEEKLENIVKLVSKENNGKDGR